MTPPTSKTSLGKGKGAGGGPQSFASIPHIHPLILRGLASLSITHPTPIQKQFIPLALSSSNDILASSRTGSGKTIAYGVPILQGILTSAPGAGDGPSGSSSAGGVGVGTKALVLCPTRELCEQVTGALRRLAEGCEQGRVKVVNIAGGAGENAGRGKGGKSAEKVQR